MDDPNEAIQSLTQKMIADAQQLLAVVSPENRIDITDKLRQLARTMASQANTLVAFAANIDHTTRGNNL